MKSVNKNKQVDTASIAPGKQRSYNEIVELLNSSWNVGTQDESLSCITQLDKAFGGVAKKLNTITIAGSNGKSLTIHFATQLLRKEGLAVGSFYAPHILTYNERIAINDETISNKQFTELANNVINTAESLDLKPNTLDLLTMVALLHFKEHNVDVAIVEMSTNMPSDSVAICSSTITAITRITDQADETSAIKNILKTVQPGSHVISADQSKLNLHVMQKETEEVGAVWAMPIRKLAPLVYPFEQLHGRCAALAERIAHIYVNEFAHKDAVILTDSLLTKKKGNRGRPTREAKREAELNPRQTVEQFWKETISTLPGRFQLLDKEKPTVLVDNASNIDAFKNILLGIRLLHYQRPLKGIAIILGFESEQISLTELFKLLRYFFKKTSGQVILCPTTPTPRKGTEPVTWDLEKIANETKNMKIKVRAADDFEEAFEIAQKSVDERHGLVIVTGSSSIVSKYWKHKGIKKL